MGDQAAGKVDCVQRGLFDPCKPFVGERARIPDKRADDQVVLGRLAVGIVGQGIDPGGERRLPGRFGQFLDCGEGLAGKNRALPRRDGDERNIGCGIGLLQRVQRGELRIVLIEKAAVIVGHADEGSARRRRQHDQAGEQQDRPPALKNEADIAVEGRWRRHPVDRPKRTTVIAFPVPATADGAVRRKPAPPTMVATSRV